MSKNLVSGEKNLTPFEKIIEKKKGKKKQKKLERKKKLMENQEGSEEVDSSDDIPSDIDMNDPYFAEEFNKPEFKKSKLKGRDMELKETNDEEDERKKAELELLLDDENDGKAHFSLKQIQEAENDTKKSKRKKKLKAKKQDQKQADDFKVDLDDERFSALYNSHLYNIDPTDSNFKKTKNMERIIQEKLKRRPTEIPQNEVQPKRSKEDAQLSLLVKNIKRKTKNVLK